MPKDFNHLARGSKQVVRQKSGVNNKQPQKRIKNKEKYLPKGNKQKKPKKEKINKNEKEDLKRKRDSTTEQEGEPVSKKPMRRDREMEGKQVTSDILDNAKRLWEKARNSTLEEDVRKKALTELTAIVSGKCEELLFKHDASRIIQAILKLGTQEQRIPIINELRGHMVELSQSHYGHFIVIKCLEYSTPELRNQLIEEFTGFYSKLLRHKEAAGVIEYIYGQYANASQRSDLLLEFYGSDILVLFKGTKKSLEDIFELHPNKKETILKNLSEILNPVIEKGVPIIRFSIVHFLMLQYLTNAPEKEALELARTIDALVPEILHTKEGARVGVFCVGKGMAKDRKVIIRALKGLVAKACMEEYGHVVILKLLETTDDTQLVEKVILTEMLKDVKNLLEHRYGRLAFLHIVAPKNPKYFPVATINMLEHQTITKPNGEIEPTSKKPSEQRQAELLSKVIDELKKHFVRHIQKLMREQHTAEVLFESLNHIKEPTEIFNAIAELAGEAEENNIIDAYPSSLILKRMLKAPYAEPLAEVLASKIQNKHKWAMNKNSSFIILSLLEKESLSKQIEKELKPHLAELQKGEEKGTKLIVNALKGIKTEYKPKALEKRDKKDKNMK